MPFPPKRVRYIKGKGYPWAFRGIRHKCIRLEYEVWHKRWLKRGGGRIRVASFSSSPFSLAIAILTFHRMRSHQISPSPHFLSFFLGAHNGLVMFYWKWSFRRFTYGTYTNQKDVTLSPCSSPSQAFPPGLPLTGLLSRGGSTGS